MGTITDHLPIFAVVNNTTRPDKNKNAGNNKTWQKIDETKKDLFVDNLKKSLSSIDSNDHPENILKNLIDRTKNTIDACFPPKSLSNRALKRAEQPWFDKEICKS